MKYTYVQEELEAAVQFISENGIFDKTTVHNSIMNNMKLNQSVISTMGYTLKISSDGEDGNMVEILVNPALGDESSRKYITMEGDTVVDVEYVE